MGWANACRRSMPRTRRSGRAVYINDLVKPGMLWGKHQIQRPRSRPHSDISIHPRPRSCQESRLVHDRRTTCPTCGSDSCGTTCPLKKGQGAPVPRRSGGRGSHGPGNRGRSRGPDRRSNTRTSARRFSIPEEALIQPGAPLIHETDVRGEAEGEPTCCKLPWKLVCGAVDEGRAAKQVIWPKDEFRNHMGQPLLPGRFRVPVGIRPGQQPDYVHHHPDTVPGPERF